MDTTLKRLLDFFHIQDEEGVSNLDRIHKYQKILRRTETTDRNKSVEAIENNSAKSSIPNGIVMERKNIIKQKILKDFTKVKDVLTDSPIKTKKSPVKEKQNNDPGIGI